MSCDKFAKIKMNVSYSRLIEKNEFNKFIETIFSRKNK